MYELDGHAGPLAMDGIFARGAKMEFTQEVRPLPDGKPVVIGKLEQYAVLVAVVDDVEIRRLVIELEVGNRQFLGVFYVNRSLHLTCRAELRPMAWARRTSGIGIGWSTRFLTENQVQVMVFHGMVLVLTGLDLLGGLRDPTGGERTQEDQCENGKGRSCAF